MKRPAKITLITLGSILGVLVIAIIIVCNIVFCPKTLTPIVRNNIDMFITCPTNVDTVDLTFFSTFPDFSLNLHNVQVVNPTEGAQSDTLARVEHLTASINVKEFLLNGNLIINEVTLNNAVANLYTDSLGKTNFDIIKPSSEEEEDTTSSPLFDLLDLNNVTINNLSATYVDETMGIDATAQNLNCSLDGQLQGANADVDLKLSLDKIRAIYNDSTNIFANLDNINLSANGDVRDNHFTGEVALNLPQTTFALDGDTLTNKLPIQLDIPAEVNFDIMHINLKDALLDIAENQLKLNGVAQIDENINLDVKYATNDWVIEDIIALIPASYQHLLDGIKATGVASVDGSVSGTYNDSLMPVVNANIKLKNGTASYSSIPYKLRAINTSLSAKLDLNKGQKSNATIHNLSAKTGTMFVAADGTVNDLLGNLRCNLRLRGDINLPELKPILPEDLNVKVNGRVRPDIHTKFSLNDITNFNIERIYANGNIKYTNLDVVYNDSISIKDIEGCLSVNLPSPHKNKHFKELAQASIKGNDIDFNMVGMMNAKLTKPNLTVGIGEFRDTTRAYSAICKLEFENLMGSMDTINFDIKQPSAEVQLFPSKKNKKNPSIKVKYSNAAIKANMGSFLNVNTQHMGIAGSMAYHDNQNNFLSKLKPTLDVDFNEGHFDLEGFGAPIEIPAIKFQFRPNNFDIEDSRIIIKDSDFGLAGNITNLNKFIKKKGLLKGTLDFTSSQTNVDQLMDLINGLGTEEETDTTEKQEVAKVEQTNDTTKASEPNPFMVPKGVDIALNTHIKKALFSGNEIGNVGGKLTVKDGIVVLEQMGFTTDAAEMQLTGMYRSDRRNHLFCGIDFHLLNIDIKELIHMIPSVDTIVPMLKSFDGKAQFHIAAETYLKANYEPKMSTLRAAAAIEGKDLVVLDNETFSTIAKYMMFNKKTKNVIDSLDVEMTVFRDEIDIYPFAISMDKWQAVLSGRHNLDMSFDYHISLTKCPLPVRLGLEIKGTFDDLKFKLVPCKYKALYRPEKQKATDKRTLALKKLISDSLKDNVK